MPAERKREKKQKDKTEVKTEEADGLKIGKLVSQLLINSGSVLKKGVLRCLRSAKSTTTNMRLSITPET